MKDIKGYIGILFLISVIVFLGFYTVRSNSQEIVGENLVEVRVNSGDTLWGISREVITNYNEFNSQQIALLVREINGLSSSEVLQEGQVVLIPEIIKID